MNEISIYQRAKQALAEYKTVDEVKDVRDKAMAIRLYAKQANDRTLENDAIETRLRAERRLGQILEENKGERAGVGNPILNIGLKPTLKQLGIDYNLAQRANELRKKSEEEFEEYIKNAVKNRTLTNRTEKLIPRAEAVEYLHSRVREFLYAFNPEELSLLKQSCLELVKAIDDLPKEKIRWLSSTGGN